VSRPQRISIWSIQNRASSGTTRPWVARWSIDQRGRSRSFTHKREAEDFLARLRVAKLEGVRFSNETGEPVTWGQAAADLTAAAQHKKAVRRVHEWVLCLVTVGVDDAEFEARRAYIRNLESVATAATDGSPDNVEELRERLLRTAGNIPDSVRISKVVPGEVDQEDGRKCVVWMFEMPNGESDALSALEDVHRRFVEANPGLRVVTCSTPVRHDDGALNWYLNVDHLPHAALEIFDGSEPGEVAAFVGQRLLTVSGEADLPFDLLKPP
jgi:hypothetical protein